MSETESSTPLADQLLEEPVFSRLIDDSQTLVATELKKKNMALRTGFNMIQKARPDLVGTSLRSLLPSFVDALEPFYARAQQTGASFEPYLKSHDEQVADALLRVSDQRVQKVNNRAIKSGYQRLRSRAHKEVVAAMPELAALMDKHTA